MNAQSKGFWNSSRALGTEVCFVMYSVVSDFNKNHVVPAQIYLPKNSDPITCMVNTLNK